MVPEDKMNPAKPILVPSYFPITRSRGKSWMTHNSKEKLRNHTLNTPTQRMLTWQEHRNGKFGSTRGHYTSLGDTRPGRYRGAGKQGSPPNDP